jgi:twinkle protein
MPKTSSGKFEIPTLYSVNGSSYFYNKADVGITVYRDDELTTVHIQKVKFEGIYGKKGQVEMIYDKESCRFNEIGQLEIKSNIDIPNVNLRIEAKGKESDFDDF